MKIPIRQEKADYYTAVEKTAKAMKNGTYKVPINEITAEFLGDVDAKYVMFKNGRFITDTGTGINPETWHTLDPVTAIGMAGGEPRPSYSQIGERIRNITDVPFSIGMNDRIIFGKRLAKDVMKRVKNELPYYHISQPPGRLQVAAILGVMTSIAAANSYFFGEFLFDNHNGKDNVYAKGFPDDTLGDSDHDGLSDYYEDSVYHTDKLSKDTDRDGIDDFNEIFTYPDDLNPNDPGDAQRFMEKIPDVKASPWGQKEDESFEHALSRAYEISSGDPLMKYYAENTEILWQDNSDGSVGKLLVSGEPLIKGVPEFENTDEALEIYRDFINPSYILSNERIGLCGHSALTSFTLLKMKGFEAKIMGAQEKNNRYCDECAHAWTEFEYDGAEFVVDWGKIIPKDAWNRKFEWQDLTELLV